MDIQVNGEARSVEADTTVQALLAALGLDEKTVVVLRNDEVVTLDQFGETTLSEGDQIELVRFVGGG